MSLGSAMSTPSRCSSSTDSGRAGQKPVSPAMPTFGWKKATNDPSAATAGRVADERAWAADVARFEREQARERRLVAAKNRVTVVEHPPTLVNRGDAADLDAQQKAAVAASRGALPPDFLKFLPLP